MDNAVLDTSNPAVHTKEIELRLYIAPAWLADPMEGIREQLDRMVLRYVDQLDGVLLSYEDLRLKMSALGQPLGKRRAQRVRLDLGLQLALLGGLCKDEQAAKGAEGLTHHL